MESTGRNAFANNLSAEEAARLANMANEVAAETNSYQSPHLARIIRSGDIRDLQSIQDQLIEKRSRGPLNGEERQMVSAIQKRITELEGSTREGRMNQRRRAQRERHAERAAGQQIPQRIEDIEITAELAERLIQLKYEPTPAGLLEAARAEQIDLLNPQVGRVYDNESELDGIREKSRDQLRDWEADEAARNQNFGGVVGDNNRQAGSFDDRQAEYQNALLAREESRDFDRKRAERQGTFQLPAREAMFSSDGRQILGRRENARPGSPEEAANRRYNLESVPPPPIPDVDPKTKQRINKNDPAVIEAYAWGGPMHKAAVNTEKGRFIKRINRQWEHGILDYERDADGSFAAVQDIVGEENKRQDFNQINPNEQYDRLLNDDPAQQPNRRIVDFYDRPMLDSQGRERIQGSPAPRDEWGGQVTERGFFQGNASGSGGGNSAVADAVSELEEAINNGMLDPNMPMTQEALQQAGLGDLFDRGSARSHSQFDEADLSYKVDLLVNEARAGNPEAMELVKFNESVNPADGKFFKGEPVINKQVIEAARSMQIADDNALASNRARVFDDLRGRSVGQFIQDLRGSNDPAALARADRNAGRAAVQRDSRIARGQLTEADRRIVIEQAERDANRNRRPAISPFSGNVGEGLNASEIQQQRIRNIKDDANAAAARNFVEDKGKAEAASILELVGVDPSAKSAFAEGDPATPHQFISTTAQDAIDRQLRERAPQAAIDHSNRRAVNNAKAGIDVVQAQINTLARAARRKGSALNSSEKQRILQAMTQEIFPGEQIVKLNGSKAKFDRELVKGTYESKLREFDGLMDDSIVRVPIVDRSGYATPVMEGGEIVNYVDPVSGLMVGEGDPDGFFNETDKQWLSATAANRPVSPGQQWVNDHLFDRFDADQQNPTFKNQELGRPLQDLTDAFRLKGVPLSGNIHTVEDLQFAADEYVRTVDGSRNAVVSHFDFELGKQVPIEGQPTIGDVLEKLKVSPADQKRVARAIHIQDQALQFDKNGRRANNTDKAHFENDQHEGRLHNRRVADYERQAALMEQEQFGPEVGTATQEKIRRRRMREADRTVKTIGRDATINGVGDAVIVDGMRTDARGRQVKNRVEIAPQLRQLDPYARIQSAIQADLDAYEPEIQKMPLAEQAPARAAIKQRREIELGINDVDSWLADARMPLIGAAGINQPPAHVVARAEELGLNRTPERPNRGGNSPGGELDQPQPVFGVNLNADDEAINKQLVKRGLRKGAPNIPANPQEMARLQSIRDDQINADFARAQIGSGSRIPREPNDAAGIRMFEHLENQIANHQARPRLTPGEEQIMRLAEEHRQFGTSPSGAQLGINPDVMRNQMINAAGDARAAGYPGLADRGMIVDQKALPPAPGQPGYESMRGTARPMNATNQSSTAYFPNAVRVNSPGIEFSQGAPWGTAPGIGRMPTATQAPAQNATSQIMTGAPNYAAPVEMSEAVVRRPAAPAQRSIGDVWSSNETPDSAVFSEMKKRTGGRSAPDPWVASATTPSRQIPDSTMEMLGLPHGTQTRGPAQGPVPGSARKQMGDRVNHFKKSPRYERARKYGGRGAAVAGAGAAVAGINGLIGGERERREEEQMAYMR